jgi:hypothetical protein
MRKYILLIFALINSLLSAQGIQNNNNFGNNFFPQSPNATPFALQGKYPVNLYKGVPVVSIPLFNTSNGQSNFAISLDYNVNSVKPATIPTWVGLGWNLNIGGSVTRIVNGGVDEVFTSTKTPHNIYSYLDNSNTLNSTDWDGQAKMQTYAQNNIDYISPANAAVKAVPSPDEFIINIAGFTGSFYLNHQGQWVGRTREGRTFKVIHIYKNDFELKELQILGGTYNRDKTYYIKRILYGFNITMDDGTLYRFGLDDNNIEFTSTPENVDPNFNPHIVPSAWNIKEIVYSDGKKINFTYERDLRSVFVVNMSGNASYYKQGSSGWGNIGNSASGGNLKDLQSNRLSTVLLKKVEGENFIIDLGKVLANQKEYGPLDVPTGQWIPPYEHHINSYSTFKHWYSLTNIFIKDKTGNMVKNIAFNYNNDPSDRLMLKEINIGGIEKYSFQYNSQKLPEYISDATDHWGHYNGTSFYASLPTNTSLSVDQLKNLLTNSYPSYKTPHLNYAKAQVLEQITYPTGGSTSFEYELNDYSKYGEKDITQTLLKINNSASTKEIAGGLRISKIKSCDENNNCLNKTYSYLNDDGSSSGVLPYKPLYMIEGSEPNINLIFWEFNSNSYQTLKGEDNSVCYSKVTEIDDNGGKKETYFTNLDQTSYTDRRGNSYVGWITPTLFNQLPYLSYSLMRGKVLKEVVYSDTHKISETINTYTQQTDYLRAYTFNSKRFGEPAANGPYTDLNGVSYGYLLDAHYVNFNSSFLSQRDVIIDGVSSTENYNYDYNYNIPTSITKTVAGDIFETSYTYPSINHGAMLQKYMVGVPTHIANKKNNILLSKIETKFPQTLPDTQTGNLVLPLSQISYDMYTGTAEKEVNFDFYDTKGNLLQYTTKSGVPTAIVWGYNQTQPIAKIEGATYAQTSSLRTTIVNASDTDAAAGPDNDETSFLKALDDFRKEYPDFLISTYTYDPIIGVRSITPPSGIREFYKYDTNNRLERIVDADNNIIKEFKYNYAIVTFYNYEESKSFTKNNCGSDHVGSTHIYTVPAHTYSSTISQQAAQQLAKNDINANGQNVANNVGTCYHQCITYGDGNFVESNVAALIVDEISTNNYSGFINVSFIENAHHSIDLGNLGTCAPTTLKEFTRVIDGISWSLKLFPDGSVTIKGSGGNIKDKSVSFSFAYNK